PRRTARRGRRRPREDVVMSPTQCAIHLVSANLGRLLGPHIPAAVVKAGRSCLGRGLPAKRLRGAWVMAFGDDLHIHLVTCNQNFSGGEDPRAFAAKVAREAALAALGHGREMGLCGALPRADPRHLSAAELEVALDLRQLDYPFTERGAEPVVVAKALNGSWGFFNRALFNLYFNPDKGSGHRIEGNDFRAIVESVADLRAGKDPVQTFEFGPG